jgi:hypothetical protein
MVRTFRSAIQSDGRFAVHAYRHPLGGSLVGRRDGRFNYSIFARRTLPIVEGGGPSLIAFRRSPVGASNPKRVEVDDRERSL